MAIALRARNRADTHIGQLHERISGGIRHLHLSDTSPELLSQIAS